MKLYFNPISSYSQKVLMAFYEKNAAFEPVVVNLMDPQARAEYSKVYPIGTIPFMRIEASSWDVPESSIIIEYIDRHCPGGTKLIPDDPDLARQVRMRDRFCDNFINNPMQKIFFDTLRPAGKKDPFGVEQARERLNAALAMLEDGFADGREWAMGKDFSMADCAAAPPLAYARMVNPFDQHKHVTAYLDRLTARPSFARCLKEAAPMLAQMQAKQ